MTRRDHDAVRPLTIGPRNAEAAVGQSWRWCRDHARAWGVPILRVDAKPIIPVDAFLTALESHAAVEGGATEHDEVDELEALRRRLGKRRTNSPSPGSAKAAQSGESDPEIPHGLPRQTTRRAG